MLWHQDFSFADVICGADQPILFHLLHKPRGFVITNSQFSLDVAGRTFAIFGNDLHGRVIERIFQIRIATETKHRVNITLSRLARTLQNSRKQLPGVAAFSSAPVGELISRELMASSGVKDSFIA